MSLSHDTWHSPLSYRYGSSAMRQAWSEIDKRKTWRRVWVALARAQSKFGLVSQEEILDLEAHVNDIDVAAAEEIEKEIKHDLVAELQVFASQCPVGGRIIHLGATSMDIEDNADALRIKGSLTLIRESLSNLLKSLVDLVEQYSDHLTMGFTHLQPAEPTSLGYRFAQWGQDLLEDLRALDSLVIRGKGIKGATGTYASYVEMLGPEGAEELERLILEELDIDAFPVTTQTYPRKQDLNVVNVLAGIGQSLYRLAYDIRLLQSPTIGEIMEPFGKHQVGSSAMPFKRNPVASENIDSLARQLAALPRIAWDNAAHCHLERTLDDSANRRSMLPEAFLLTDAIISRTHQVISNLVVNAEASNRLLDTYGTFAATEKLMLLMVQKGADRQKSHEILREHSISAWKNINNGGEGNLVKRLLSDEFISRYVSSSDLREIMYAHNHVGLAPQKAKQFAKSVREELHR